MQNMPWRKAIIKVMEESEGVELSSQDIANAVIERGYRTSVGKTPANTVPREMTKIISEGVHGVDKVRPGVYILHPSSDKRDLDKQDIAANHIEKRSSTSEEPEKSIPAPDAASASAIEVHDSKEAWTLREAKAHLLQILRLSQVDGPQHIIVSQVENQHIHGHQTFVIVPEEVWREKNPPQKTLGQMLLEDMPKGIGEKEPEYDESGRYIPFSDVIWE